MYKGKARQLTPIAAQDFSWRDFSRLATADAAVKDPIGVHRLPDIGSTPVSEFIAYFKVYCLRHLALMQ